VIFIERGVMLTPFGYFDLIETFPADGCAMCRLTERDVQRHLDSIIYEHVTDPLLHAKFRASRGLCMAHGKMLIQPGNSLGVATLYEAVVDELTKIAQNITSISPTRGFSRLVSAKSSGNALADALSPDQPCIGCETQSASEIRYAQTLAEHITDPKLHTAYAESRGLCLTHFRITLNEAKNAASAKRLISTQTDIWGKLRAELAEFRRKYDFQNVDEAIGAEGDSWKRAVLLVGGE